MPTTKPGSVVRVLQEDWAPFQNIRRTAQAFTARTGVEVEVVLSQIPDFWKLIERSFREDAPPFDLVGADEIMLRQFAREGIVESLDGMVAADDYDLSDFEPAILDAVSYEGRLYGLPYAAVASVLIYRQDLFERYGFTVPQTMDQLTETALAIQKAVRADGQADFYGITLRGAPSCGLNFWTIGSNWAPAWGVKWYDDRGQPTLDNPEFSAALEHYLDLLHRAGPPRSWTFGFVECMDCYRDGKAAMVIEPANEASMVFEQGGPIAEGTATALVPAGPLNTRHAGL